MAPYLVSLLPLVFYLLLLVYWDAFTVIRKLPLGLCLLWGLALWGLLHWALPPQTHPALRIFLEEGLKLTLVWMLLRRDSLAFLSDAAVYGAAVGVAFSLIENFKYAIASPAEPVLTLVYGGFATSLLHIGLTSLAAALVFILSRWNPGSRLARRPFCVLLISLFAAFVLRYAYSFMDLNPQNALTVMVIVVAALLGLFFRLSKERMGQWMEISMAQEVELAASLKSGQFADTPAGRYLLLLKGRFQPQVFFDMLVYLNLFLDLSLNAKRLLMLKEVDLSPAPQDVAEFKNKAKELKQLRRSIGRAGLTALRPVVDSQGLNAVINLFK